MFVDCLITKLELAREFDTTKNRIPSRRVTFGKRFQLANRCMLALVLDSKEI